MRYEDDANDDIGEMFRAINKQRQEARASHRKTSPEHLRAAGVNFLTKNDGAHLVVTTKRGLLDFWPGTGLWIDRTTRREGRGVFNLLRFLEKPVPPKEGGNEPRKS
jgi:hypothetical protein